jgi:hypothetical protein
VPDDKIYIPSHHLAIIEVPHDSQHSAEYLRLILQSDFARRYFWAYATGKSQKEISNWSIRNIPIPQSENPERVVEECLAIEQEMKQLMDQLRNKQVEKEKVLYEAVQRTSIPS